MDRLVEYGLVIIAASLSAFLGARSSVWVEGRKVRLEAEARAVERRQEFSRRILLEVLSTVSDLLDATIRAIDVHGEEWLPKKIIAVDHELRTALRNARLVVDQMPVDGLRGDVELFLDGIAGVVNAETVEEALAAYSAWVGYWHDDLRQVVAAVQRSRH